MTVVDAVSYVGLSALAVVGWGLLGLAARKTWDRVRVRYRGNR